MIASLFWESLRYVGGWLSLERHISPLPIETSVIATPSFPSIGSPSSRRPCRLCRRGGKPVLQVEYFNKISISAD